MRSSIQQLLPPWLPRVLPSGFTLLLMSWCRSPRWTLVEDTGDKQHLVQAHTPSGKERTPGFQPRVIPRLGPIHSGQFALRAPTKRILCAEGTGSGKC